jgi:putative GTP pyrophosphokinase
MVEVQYQTRAQHAWATALEISNILDWQRTKFWFAEDEGGMFFEAEGRLGILQRLGAMR